MTLTALIELASINVDLSDPNVKARLQAVRERQRKFDEQLEEQVRLKQPSNELLNRSCSI